MSDRKLPTGNALLFTGVALLVLGVTALISPSWAGQTVFYLIGGLLLITGIGQFLLGWNDETKSGQVSRMTLGIITGMAGLAVLIHPVFGAGALAAILAIFFVFDGIWKVVTSFSYRPATGWLAFLGSGILSLVLAWMLWKQWPFSGNWAVGILVGINLLSTGISLIAVALTWKSALEAGRERVAELKDRLS
jgi:uncharacterized membrane protein HdeD (DUF308 family)